jgi:hypothetical protein
MTMVALFEAEIQRRDSVQLWGVQGLTKRLYPTKMVAEIAARARFPDEAESTRYARIFYKTYEVVE